MRSIARFTSFLGSPCKETWKKFIIQLGKDHGFDRTLLAVVPNRQTPFDQAFVCSDYPSEWLNIYRASHMELIDPVVSHCMSRNTPLIWKPELFTSKPQREMYEIACSHGLRSGLALPYHGAHGEIGMLCFASDAAPSIQFQRAALSKLPELSLMREFAFAASRRFATSTHREPLPLTQHQPPALTQRELECLKWSANGKSSWEIAEILSVTEATVNFHFANLRRKFAVNSRRQVVVKAMHLGLLSKS
jgi:LuxR family transcriptional regulator, quorum-sensing system regulator LasR